MDSGQGVYVRKILIWKFAISLKLSLLLRSRFHKFVIYGISWWVEWRSFACNVIVMAVSRLETRGNCRCMCLSIGRSIAAQNSINPQTVESPSITQIMHSLPTSSSRIIMFHFMRIQSLN